MQSRVDLIFTLRKRSPILETTEQCLGWELNPRPKAASPTSLVSYHYTIELCISRCMKCEGRITHHICFNKYWFHLIDVDVDIDECAVNNGNCSENANCTNTHGSFDCTCNSGYTGDGYTCIGMSTEAHVLCYYASWVVGYSIGMLCTWTVL